jgi:hypothetical protein
VELAPRAAPPTEASKGLKLKYTFS